MQSSHRVEICGQQYTLRGEADSAYIQGLAAFVEQKVKEVSSLPGEHSFKTAILAAINITDELFQLRRQQKQSKDSIDRRTRDIIEQIEEQFETEAGMSLGGVAQG